MAVDMFLELDGIKGESVDATHKDKIDVLSWSWGLSNTGTFHHGSGGGAGKANFQDISITKYIDKATADLWYHTASGKHIAKGSLAELATQLEIARDVGYFTAVQVEPLIGQCVELGKMLGALIRARSNPSPRAPSPKPRA